MERKLKVLVTGAAGFIGFHVARALLERGDEVIGYDNLNNYYDVALKKGRVSVLLAESARGPGRFSLQTADLENRSALDAAFAAHGFDRVIHLAAQAGVRHSIEQPHDYVQSNVAGFLNVIEACRHHGTGHLTYASTSSVYGANRRLPFSEHDHADHPLQLYAASKRANELMAHSYSHLFGLPTTGLRFFTVYGPWGRPDMALFVFARKILAGEPIPVFNFGEQTRDFTFVADVVDAVVRVSDAPAVPNPDWDPMNPDPQSSTAPYRIFNIGNSAPVKLSAYIEALEAALGRTARQDLLPMQPGDVTETHADVLEFSQHFGWKPATDVSEGVSRFVEWYLDYYKIA